LYRLLDLQENFQQQQQQQQQNKQSADENERTKAIDPSLYQGDRVAKLLEERDTLLQTGVYTNDDPVIEELDKQIRQLIAKNTG